MKPRWTAGLNQLCPAYYQDQYRLTPGPPRVKRRSVSLAARLAASAARRKAKVTLPKMSWNK